MQFTQSSATTLTMPPGNVFENTPVWVSSPGRINIIGEHTDYNNGFVLPAAIDKAVQVRVAKRQDSSFRLISLEYKEEFSYRPEDIRPVDGWPDYISGVAHQLINRGYKIGGFTLVLEGNVPIGAGLSSSAAVECAVVFALDQLFALKLSRFEMAEIAQAAEHNFAGVQCGIMDQFASLFGKKDHAIRLDCQNLTYEYIPLRMDGLKILLLNSNVVHSLRSTEYNVRRAQCDQGVALIKESYAGVESLRDVTMDMLHQCVKEKDALVFQRCKYVVEENARLLSACDALENGDMVALGKQMFRSHEGLSKEYEVSCKELDLLVNWVKDNPAVLGARMMGGGFGGCTINLVKEEAIDELLSTLSEKYEKTTGLTLTPYIASIENGTHVIM